MFVSFLAGFAVVLRLGDFAVLEDRGVEDCGFLCAAVEPETGSDLTWHCVVDDLISGDRLLRDSRSS